MKGTDGDAFQERGIPQISHNSKKRGGKCVLRSYSIEVFKDGREKDI